MTEHQHDANWNVAEWHGKMLIDREGEKIGKLQDVYVDTENDEPQFATVKEGFISRHLTFVPLGGITVGPDELQVAVTKAQVQSAPNIEQHGEELSQADESALYHHYELNYTPPNTESGRRLARRSRVPPTPDRTRLPQQASARQATTSRICVRRFDTPASASSSTWRGPSGSDPPAPSGCGASIVPASRQKNAF